jgi:hypothetical protein
MNSVQKTAAFYIRYLSGIVLILLFTLSREAISQVRITDGSVLTMDINSLLELESTTKGLLIPRVAIGNLTLEAPLTAPVPTGMLVYSLGGAVSNGFYFWNGTSWNMLATGSAGQWITNGTNIYYNTGNVGIGVTVPVEPLEVNGNIKIGSTTTGTIRSTNELVLRQDGDVYGPSILRLRNRTAENGAIFETTDATYTLVDFILKDAANQGNIRFESRATQARTGVPSFHIGGANPDNPTLSLGYNYAAFNKNVRIGDYTTPLTALDVNGQITLRTGASTGAVLVSDVNGTGSWQSIGSVSETPLTKSVSVTLLKTETFILASGDITLTLPVVTATDNGLAITIKNIGTYLNLITVNGNSGATIDGISDANLTRWRGQTYIAWNGNWVTKNKETKTDNLLDVSSVSSFTTIAEVVGFLNLHMSGPTVVRLAGGTHNITATQTISLPYPVTFQGLSFGEATISGAAGVSGSPLFICASECYFKMLTFTAFSNASGNDGLRLTTSGTYHEIKDCTFSGFNKGIVSTNNHSLIWVFEVAFIDCAGAGIEIADGTAIGGSIKISEGLFQNCAKGVSLLSGVGETVSIYNTNFYNTISGTDIGIQYTPATFTSFSSMFISSNAWNSQGTFISGFDFSRSDGRDANAYLKNNAGLEDEGPHSKVNVNNNVTTTTITTAGTFYKANWVNTSTYTTKFTLANNRITYQPVNKRDAWAIISGNIAVNNANRVITIAVYKNGTSGTRFGDTDLRVTVSNQPFQFSTVIYVPDMARNDYLELFVTSSSNNDVVTFQDIQWFTNTQ